MSIFHTLFKSVSALIRCRLSSDSLFKWQVTGVAMLVMVLLSSASMAAEVPRFNQSVLINAREQPVGQFISDLFGQIGVPVLVDDSIGGSVNGDFRKSARGVFSDIASSFQLTLYYDGAVAHVFPSNAMKRSVLHMSAKNAHKVKNAALKLSLTDQRNLLEVTDVGLVVTGANPFVEQIESLASATREARPKVKVPTEDTYRIFKLKYAWADDVSLAIGGETVVVPGVASLLRTLIEPGAMGSPATTLRVQGSPTMDGLRGQGLQAVGNQVGSGSMGAGQPSVSAGTAPVAGSTERTRIVADPLTNSVIIRDKADRMAGYEQLVESLDKEPQMIEIEATIIDLDTDRMRELGINWRLQKSDGVAMLGNGTATDRLMRPGSDVTPQAQGGVVSLVLGSRADFIARIRALETQGVARIVSKPHVMTLSNVEALLDTTSTFYVRVAGQEEVDLFDVSVGTTLRVTPHVYDNAGRSQIKLRVNIEDGTTSDRQVDSIPIVERSTINTQAIIDVGQSLLIGGLVRESKGNGVTRVPVLGSIPGLGALFRTRTKTSTRQERMFLITPRVNVTPKPGKRFSVPVLSGTEADIISSASTRLDTTRQTFRLIDELDSPVQQLPQGDTLLTEDTLRTPLTRPLTADNGGLSGEPERERSLRDRLMRRPQPAMDPTEPESLPLPPGQMISAYEQVRPEGRLVSLPVEAAAQSVAVTDQGWQEVPADVVYPAAVTTTDTIGSAASSPANVEVPETDDGWQVISQ